jgi:hypothetical protein
MHAALVRQLATARQLVLENCSALLAWGDPGSMRRLTDDMPKHGIRTEEPQGSKETSRNMYSDAMHMR